MLGYLRVKCQVPALTRFACHHGQAGFVRSGKETWGVVHVLDLAKVNGQIVLIFSRTKLTEYIQAYVQVLHWAEKAPDSEAGLENPYFFCESGETTWGDIAAMIGKGLHKAGRIDTSSARPIPESEYADLFGEFTPDVVGCNCRNRADRLRSMGWKPEQLGFEDAFEREDLPVLLSEKGQFQASGMTLS